MRKLKLQTQVSVDGFMAGPNHEMDWMTWDWDDPLKKFVNDFTQPIDTILLGKNLAGGFIDAWASRAAAPDADWFSKKMVDTEKVVFSKTLEKSPWKNTVIAKGELDKEVNKLKNLPGGDLVAYGGSEFISNLSHYRLIDEYYLFVNPAAIGNGMTVFKERVNLQLVSATPYACGIVVLCYKPV